MSHWAELDENNIVIRVIVGDNNDPAGDEGYSWIVKHLGGTWKKTSYTGSIRKNFAGEGFFYDESLDAFIPPQPYPSWILDTETCRWAAPVAEPERPEGVINVWNEETQSWDASSPEIVTE